METARQQVMDSSEPQRLLKAKVHVCGRFLLRPDEDFGPERAEELMQRATKDGTKVGTSFHLYSNAIRLGNSGIFASMPLEYIKYQRVAACLSIGQHRPPVLALCTKDFEQKCVTLIRFKTPESLAESCRLIDRQRRLVAEEANYLLDVARPGNSGSENWALEGAAVARRESPPKPTEVARVTVVRAQAPARVQHSLARDSSSGDDVFYGASASRQQLQPRQQMDAVVMNYDEISAGATYAVFETSTGPPTLLNERHQVMVANSRSNGAAVPNSAVHRPASLRILTGADEVDSGFSRPQVTYVTSPSARQRANSLQQVQPQLVQLQYSSPQLQQQQQVQLVQLVPVGRRQRSQQRTPRRQHHQHQAQRQYALLPANQGGEYYLLTK